MSVCVWEGGRERERGIKVGCQVYNFSTTPYLEVIIHVLYVTANLTRNDL